MTEGVGESASAPEGRRTAGPVDLAAALVEAAPDGMAVVDEDGTLLMVNRQLEELFGYPADELVGQPVEVLVPEHRRSAHVAHRGEFHQEACGRMVGGADLVPFGRRRDGSEFPVEISLRPMQVGNRTHVVAAVRDVSERLAAETEARTVRRMLDAARDAMLIFDGDTLRLVYVNEGAVRQLGYSRQELLGMTQLDIKPDLAEDEYRQMVERLAPGESTTFATSHRRKDGTDVAVEVTLERPPEPPGEAGSELLISVARDVSLRVAAERRLRAAERELAVLDDRQRIARDLHDRVIQRLFAAGLAASSVATRLADTMSRNRLEQVVRDLDDTIADLRSSIFQLQGPSGTSLRKRVLDLCTAECETIDIASTVRFSGPVDTIDAARAEEMLAVLREALSNIARHAHASTVDVTVTVDGGIRLVIQDDGIGVSGAKRPHSGHGLDNMAARARDLGGTFAIGPRRPAGTRLAWRVPS